MSITIYIKKQNQFLQKQKSEVGNSYLFDTALILKKTKYTSDHAHTQASLHITST
jgi:hypothetical protein